MALLETQNRSLQRVEGFGPLRWSVHGASPIREWFRYRRCTGERVPNVCRASTDVCTAADNGYSAAVVCHPLADHKSDEPQCRALGPNVSTAVVDVATREPRNAERTIVATFGSGGSNSSRSGRQAQQYACGRLCTGDVSGRVIQTFRGPKDSDRAALGFHHVLKPTGCKFHWFGEAELTRCLGGRQVLNIGGSVANSVQRGFERISSSTARKTSWWWDYGRTGISNNHDEATGKSVFGRSTIMTQYIHHPFRYGLVNVVNPDPAKVAGLKSAARYENLMCRHDIVLFESGVHDFATPDRHIHRKLLGACSGSVPCTDLSIMKYVNNESWRLDQMASYRSHLEKLMAMWRRCVEWRAKYKRPTFRPIFKLSVCPNDNTELESCNADWGYNTMGSYLLAANQVARQVVEANGFEVFDTFPATQHASPAWFDLKGKDALHSDALSDLVTQMVINQLCKAPTPHESRA